MNSLLRKELRAQRPFALLIGFLALLNFSEFLGVKFLDTRSIASHLNEHSSEGNLGIIYLMLAMALALALLPREKDEGTLEFLDGLPCTRGQIFMAKALAGVLVLGLYPILDNAGGLLVHWFSRSSLDPEWPWGLFGMMLLLEWWLGVALLGVALALSYFRRFAFFALGLLFAVYIMLDAGDPSWIQHFDFRAVVRYAFRHREIDVAWTQLGTVSALGAVGYFIAWFSFRLQGDHAARVLGWIEHNHFRGPLVAIGTVMTIVVWIVLGGVLANREGIKPGTTTRVEYRDWQTSRLAAGGYVFLYPANLRERAKALADRAGDVQEKVRAFFGAESIGEIVADLDSPMRHRLAGTAEWKRVNMNITATRSLPEQMAVLGHETAHIYIDATSDGRLKTKNHFAAARWWHEGLASYVEYRMFRPPGELAKIQRVAAAAHRRKASDFELLVDDEAWRAKHDSELVYSLGEVFFEALVAEHGDAAPGKILRAICRPDAPEDATGLDLWRDAFQACGWDMSRTISAYFERLESFVTGDHRVFVESLPKLSGRVLVTGETVSIEVIVDGDLPPQSTLQCRVRRLASDDDGRYVRLKQTGERTFATDRETVGRGEFWYELGIRHPNAASILYQGWQRARVQ
jgi:hypothetical protein